MQISSIKHEQNKQYVESIIHHDQVGVITVMQVWFNL